MATRQYVGARYVPKFFENPDGSNDWAEGVSYEALTIVTYAGNNYTSKIPVPANVGSPNLNTQYWVNTGNSSGGGDINELQKQVNKNSNDIVEIKEAIGPTKKKYLFMADSWGEVRNSSNKTFLQIIKENLKLSDEECVLSGVGTSSFGNPGGVKFLTTLQNMAVKDFTDIYVFAGANDYFGTGNNVITGIKNFIDYVNTNIPGCHVYIGFTSKDIRMNSVAMERHSVEQYMKCQQYGATFLENSQYIFCKYSEFDQTYFHPVPSAIQYLGDMCTQLVTNKRCDVLRSVELTFRITSPTTVTMKKWSNTPILMCQNNNMVTMYKADNGGTLFYLEVASLEPLEQAIKMELNDSFIFSNNNDHMIPLTVFFTIAGKNEPGISNFYPIGIPSSQATKEPTIEFYLNVKPRAVPSYINVNIGGPTTQMLN